MKIAMLFLGIFVAGCATAPANVADNSGRNEHAAPAVVVNHQAGTESLWLATDRRTTLQRSPN